MSSLPTATATLPGFHAFIPPRSTPEPFDLLRTPWRRLLKRQRSVSGLERVVRREAARGRPIVLGTTAQPYDPALATDAPLAALRSFSGLQIAITSRSPNLLNEIETLTDLDRDHAVHVDVVIADPHLRSKKAREGLEMVRRLTAEGIQTRVYVPPSIRSATVDGDRWRRFFEAIRGAGAFDVKTEETATHESWSQRFRRLRLQHGFPHQQPGRG